MPQLLLSIGDGIHERIACTDVAREFGMIYRSIKLLELPTPKDISSQLKLLVKKFSMLVELDVDLRTHPTLSTPEAPGNSQHPPPKDDKLSWYMDLQESKNRSRNADRPILAADHFANTDQHTTDDTHGCTSHPSTTTATAACPIHRSSSLSSHLDQISITSVATQPPVAVLPLQLDSPNPSPGTSPTISPVKQAPPPCLHAYNGSYCGDEFDHLLANTVFPDPVLDHCTSPSASLLQSGRSTIQQVHYCSPHTHNSTFPGLEGPVVNQNQNCPNSNNITHKINSRICPSLDSLSDKVDVSNQSYPPIDIEKLSHQTNPPGEQPNSCVCSLLPLFTAGQG